MPGTRTLSSLGIANVFPLKWRNISTNQSDWKQALCKAEELLLYGESKSDKSPKILSRMLKSAGSRLANLSGSSSGISSFTSGRILNILMESNSSRKYFMKNFFYSSVLSNKFWHLSAATDAHDAQFSSRVEDIRSSIPRYSENTKEFDLEDNGKNYKTPPKTLSIDLSFLTKNMRKLVSAEHPMLNTVTQYYFDSEGKQIRPLLVLLMAKATQPFVKSNIVSRDTSAHVIQDCNLVDGNIKSPSSTYGLSDTQHHINHQKLAMIMELIHTASLLHDDVIDDASTRRLKPALHTAYGNKMAILGGDYLLSRASVLLSTLGNLSVVRTVAEVIGELVEGEVLQMYGPGGDGMELYQSESHADSVIFPSNLPLEGINYEFSKPPQWLRHYFNVYLKKTYMKTASLMAKSCKASTQLHHPTIPSRVFDSANNFGKHLGMAFQLMDDLLDFTATSGELGKPSGGADMKLGLTTAPVLYACLQHPELQHLIDRQFSSPNSSEFPKENSPNSLKQVALNQSKTDMASDIETTLNYIQDSHAVALTMNLIEWHTKEAIKNIEEFPDTEAKNMLIDLCNKVKTRRK